MLQGASNFLMSSGYLTYNGGMRMTFASNDVMYASAYWFMNGRCCTKIVLKRKITYTEFVELKSRFKRNNEDTVLVFNLVEMINWGE